MTPFVVNILLISYNLLVATIACDSVIVTKISERSEKLLEQHFFRCSLWNLDTLSEGLLEMQDLHFLFVFFFFNYVHCAESVVLSS